jgi:ribosomal-protein-serine acetyltransferase
MSYTLAWLLGHGVVGCIRGGAGITVSTMFRFTLADTRELRVLEESDVHELHGLIEANRSYLARWLPWAPAQSLDGTRAFIMHTRKQLSGNDGFQCAILDADRMIGVAGFHRVDWANRGTSVGYWLAESEQGRGTMTLAVRALIDWAFDGWALNRVEIRAATGNEPSRAVLRRLGMREEGVLRAVERMGGRYLDHVVYAVLASEWGMMTAVPSNAPERRSASASSARSSG